MLALIVVAIMMGFPTAFTLMGLGMVFGYIAFWAPAQHWYDNRIFDLIVQRTYGVMTNDTLLSIPAVRVHGLHHGAGRPGRPHVPQCPARLPARPRIPGGDDPPGLRVLGHRLRHRRRRRRPHGRDRDAADAERGLRREAGVRRDHGGRAAPESPA